MNNEEQERDAPAEIALFIGAPEDEAQLAHELGSSQTVVPGVRAGAWNGRSVAYAWQVLPNAICHSVGSIREAAEMVLRTLSSLPGDRPLRLHFLSPPEQDGKEPFARRAKLIEEATSELISKKLRSARRRLQEGESAEGEYFVQVLVAATAAVWISATEMSGRFVQQRQPTSVLGGYVPVEDDKRPPSRAYRKLNEAMLLWKRGIERGERCVDLGGSPGGWSFVALERGAQVTAVDRAPLDSSLMKHPRLSFIKGDAFSYKPERPVDWLLCDVVSSPDKTYAMLETWVKERRTKRFIVTLKFRGDPSWEIVEKTRKLLENSCESFMLRRLRNNKNEVTVCGHIST